jgi:hypothetical protein
MDEIEILNFIYSMNIWKSKQIEWLEFEKYGSILNRNMDGGESAEKTVWTELENYEICLGNDETFPLSIRCVAGSVRWG